MFSEIKTKLQIISYLHFVMFILVLILGVRGGFGSTKESVHWILGVIELFLVSINCIVLSILKKMEKLVREQNNILHDRISKMEKSKNGQN